MQAREFKSFDDFKFELEKDPTLQDEFKKDPVTAAKQIKQQNPLSTDKWIYRIIVLGLSITIISTTIGILILVGNGTITSDAGVPTILTAIGSAAIGALAGLLAPPPKKDE